MIRFIPNQARYRRRVGMLAALWLWALISPAQAQYSYRTNNGTITIYGYSFPGDTLMNVPATINGLPVTRIENQTGLSTCYYTYPYAVMATNNVTSIGTNAFAKCQNLFAITLGNLVTSIQDSAFFSCTSLPGFAIPGSVTNIGKLAFDTCLNMSAITVDANNPFYSSRDGVLFNQNQTVLMQYPAGRIAGNNYAIPQGVRNLALSAFSVTLWLTNVTVPGSVTNIGDLAFSYCQNLKGVYFLGNAPSGLGTNVFYKDNNATIYYLPGTTGWGATFGGRPTALWNPQIQTAAGLTVATNKYGFTITGTTNLPIVVEAATNLSGNLWVSLQAGKLTNGFFHFSDPQWTNYPGRFYRLRSP